MWVLKNTCGILSLSQYAVVVVVVEVASAAV